MQTSDALAPVHINDVWLKPKDAIHRRKLLALQAYVRNLLASPARSHIAKIILFGSVAKGQAHPQSDIDVMVLGFDHLDALRDASYDALLELGDFSGEGIEPLFETINEWIEPQDYFMYRVTRFGKEVYSVPEQQIKREEAAGLLKLARTYSASAQRSFDASDLRAAADLAYNACELCVKALLFFKMDDLPASHGGLLDKFGELYIKAGPFPRELGKRVSRGLEIRSWARYRFRVEITEEMACHSLTLAQEMIIHLEQTLGSNP